MRVTSSVQSPNEIQWRESAAVGTEVGCRGKSTLLLSMAKSDNPKSIELPKGIDVFRNLKNAKRFAIDIGGSLTKIAYYSTVPRRRVLYSEDNLTPLSPIINEDDFVYEVSEDPRLHFIKFETKYIETCLDFIQEQNLVFSKEQMIGKNIKATGGGAYKYTDLILSKLGLTVDKEDEMECLIEGCNFLLKNLSDEVFIFQRHVDPEYRFQSVDPLIFPYLLVNIGSGVSIMKVESEFKYERIGGTATGGGTFWGLGSLLTKATGFDELLDLAEQGDHRKVDMLVKDIYGGGYESLGLPGDLIASSFGKAMNVPKDTNSNAAPQFNDADIVRSLLFTISNDIGQIACLYAMMHGLTRVYFGGYFLRGHPLSMQSVSYAINFWSKGKVQALFLRHEGYLGAIGAFLKGAEECNTEKYSWLENYACSSGFTIPSTPTIPQTQPLIDHLEIDRNDQPLVLCPLLVHPSTYIPDTVDLLQDVEARKYWLDCFEDWVEKIITRAVASQPNCPDALTRAQKFKEKYVLRLNYLKEHPFAYGSLTVRSLLDTIEHLLKEFDFPDPYFMQKQRENEVALTYFQEVLNTVDVMKPPEQEICLIESLLSGNVFDWGAKEVADLMDSPGFGFYEAKNKLQRRPWLVDSLDEWVERLKGPPHKCAAIFVDNSGFDIILGVIPFARHLLQRGTQVILCSNSKPALNDVTHSELRVILKQVGTMCDVIKIALEEDRLVAMENGQASPCLDLCRLNGNLANEMMKRQVDLIVLEGMGRSLHTNLYAQFKCECLKVAVIKNRWLAERLGGDMFSVMCKYEPQHVLSNLELGADSKFSSSSSVL